MDLPLGPWDSCRCFDFGWVWISLILSLGATTALTITGCGECQEHCCDECIAAPTCGEKIVYIYGRFQNPLKASTNVLRMVLRGVVGC